jgi:hypothetical protein
MKWEKSIMFGIPSSLVYEVALAVQSERIERASQAMQVREAARGGHGRFHVIVAIRHGFGRALIALGQSVHGARIDANDHSSVPSSGTLRLAR